VTLFADPGRPSGSDVAAVLDLLGADDTAVIVCDLTRLRAHLEILRSAFPSAVEHAVAIKTMPHPRMLACLVEEGFGLEAASFEEVELAIAAGAPAHRIIFDSPVKTAAEIERCDARYPGMLCNANSLEELTRYSREPAVQVGLRINPEQRTSAPALFDVSGPSSKFGVPLSRRDEILDASLTSPFQALHLHIGSQVGEVDSHIAAVRLLVDRADEIDAYRAAAASRHRITILDIGGGLAADAVPGGVEGHTIVHELATRLAAEVPHLFDRQVRTEFGQWVHTHAGWVASRVEYVDEVPRSRAFIHLGADFFLRDVYTDPRPFGFAVYRADGGLNRAVEARYDLAGPLCFAGDNLGEQVPLPHLEVGDWLVIEGTGANTLGLWSRHCSRAIPAVVAVDERGVSVWSPRRSVT
jgi:diaminopimelate decarboxylase